MLQPHSEVYSNSLSYQVHTNLYFPYSDITVPGAPKLTSVLPYYDSTSRELKKIDIQIMTDSSVDDNSFIH